MVENESREKDSDEYSRTEPTRPSFIVHQHAVIHNRNQNEKSYI